MENRKAETIATWNISLNCHCPNCGEFIDLISADFWMEHERLQPVETRTENSNNLDVTCPKCDFDFEVCCEY